MAYLRPIRKDELEAFLQENEDLDNDDLAQLMIDKFDILILSNSPQ